MTGREPAVEMGTATPRLHLKHVEGLRALAALVVYVNHAYAQTWHPAHGFAPGAWSAFAYSLLAGHLAVSVFIVISGFCLALPVVDANDELRRGAMNFFKRRARRILPPYYGALAVSLVLIATVIGEPTGSLWDVPIQLDWVAVVSHTLLLQDLFGTGKINYVFWSIAVEWQIYFLFPLFVWGVRRYGMVKVVVVALIAGYALRFAGEGTRIIRANPHFVGLFTLGMLAAYLVRSPRAGFARARKLPWGLFALLAFGVVVGLSLHWGYESPEQYFPYLDLPVGLMAFAILVHTSIHERAPLTTVLNTKLIVFIGTFSYSVYLLHAPILQLMWQYVLVPLQVSGPPMFIALMSGGALVTLGASYGFFKVCEEPFMRKHQPMPQPVKAAPVAP